jgi:hypothetical protein
MKEKPTQKLAKLLQTDQERTSNTMTQDTRIKQLTQGKSHKWHTPVKPVTSTGQTSQAWAAWEEQHPWVNSSKTNSRSLDSLHGFKQDFGDSRNTSWALHSQVIVHQNSLK